MNGLERLSLNQATIRAWGVREAVAACAKRGIGWISLWRDRVNEYGLERSAALLRSSGLRISSLCRGGFFPASTEAGRKLALEDNRRAIDEAATLGSDTLVLVCGGLPAGSRDISGARQMVEAAIAELLPYAAERGVRLAIEPLHPMFAADRSVITSLAQANELAERLASAMVGVIIDVYHVWWDPGVYREISRCGSHIFGFHVNDWLVPTPDILTGRGMMGDGVIELRRLRQAVDEAGYRGPIEVEIFSHELWARNPDELLELVKERYLREVA